MRLKKSITGVMSQVMGQVSCREIELKDGIGVRGPGGGGVLPYMGYIGMCRCEGYGFQAVYSRIGYINQSVWV